MTALVIYEQQLLDAVGVTQATLEAVEQSYVWLHEGRATMPPVMHIGVADKNGDIDVKAAYVDGLSQFAIKIASGFYDNPQHGLPAGSGLMVLMNADTRFCEAVLLDNGYLTDLRTGLGGAVAAKHLAPADINTVGVLGTGMQARYQVRCLRLVRDFKHVLIWGRSSVNAETCAEDLRQLTGLNIAVEDSPEAVVRASQVIITVTASREPLLKSDWVGTGTHINAIGADFPGKRELPPELLTMADTLVCDSFDQCRKLGELEFLSEKNQQVHELGAVITGTAPGRPNNDSITVCDLTGVGVQDTAIALAAYRSLQAG